MESKDPDHQSSTQNASAAEHTEQKQSLKCYDFFLEWKRCISAYHQFHQYYIHGEFAKCKVEKERLYSCFKWRGTGKDKFLNTLEGSLEQEQSDMHTPDPVWELRETPPSDWTNK